MSGLPVITRSIIWSLLLLFSGNTLASAAENLGRVLCLGGDGHVLVEVSTGRDCARLFSAPPADFAAKQDSHCGQCIDIELTAPKISGHTPLADPAKSHGSTVFIVSSIVNDDTACHASWRLPEPPNSLINITLLERRTVVLLV